MTSKAITAHTILVISALVLVAPLVARAQTAHALRKLFVKRLT